MTRSSTSFAVVGRAFSRTPMRIGAYSPSSRKVQQLLALLFCAALLSANPVPKGAKIFIAPMENGLDGFIAPEIIKKKIPLVVVTDEKDADYVLSGASIKADDKWYNTVFGGKDKNEGNVRLLDVKTKQMVWAAEAGDRSLWWGSMKRGGERKVADRIVDQMKQIFK